MWRGAAHGDSVKNSLCGGARRTAIQRKIGYFSGEAGHDFAGNPLCGGGGTQHFREKFALRRAGQSAILREIRYASSAARCVFFKNTAQSRKIAPFGKKICRAVFTSSSHDLGKTHRIFS